MESKPFWASKTLWVNTVAFLGAIGGVFGIDLGLTTEAQASLVGGIMAVANIALRIGTSSAVTTTKQ